jgi:hypothetical protein
MRVVVTVRRRGGNIADPSLATAEFISLIDYDRYRIADWCRTPVGDASPP